MLMAVILLQCLNSIKQSILNLITELSQFCHKKELSQKELSQKRAITNQPI